MNYSGGNNIAIDPARGRFQVARRAFTSKSILEAERSEIFDTSLTCSTQSSS